MKPYGFHMTRRCPARARRLGKIEAETMLREHKDWIDDARRPVEQHECDERCCPTFPEWWNETPESRLLYAIFA